MEREREVSGEKRRGRGRSEERERIWRGEKWQREKKKCNFNSILYFINRIEYNNIIFEHYISEREQGKRSERGREKENVDGDWRERLKERLRKYEFYRCYSI